MSHNYLRVSYSNCRCSCQKCLENHKKSKTFSKSRKIENKSKDWPYLFFVMTQRAQIHHSFPATPTFIFPVWRLILFSALCTASQSILEEENTYSSFVISNFGDFDRFLTDFANFVTKTSAWFITKKSRAARFLPGIVL